MENSHALTDEAIRAWAAACRLRVDAFIRESFSVRGALRIHRRAIGGDLIRVPANAFLAIPMALTRKASGWMQNLGLYRAEGRLNRLPSTLRTDYQREIEWLLRTRLLEVPCIDRGRESFANALAGPDGIPPEWLLRDFQGEIDQEISAYMGSRAAFSEISASAITFGLGYFWYGSGGLGVQEMGRRLAGSLARKRAASDFFLGETLGSAWYGVFPVAPSTGQVLWATAALLALLALLTLLSSVLVDPLQAGLGIHRRKLLRLIDLLENRLTLAAARGLRPSASVGLSRASASTAPDQTRHAKN